jgi:hypothetical protein
MTCTCQFDTNGEYVPSGCVEHPADYENIPGRHRFGGVPVEPMQNLNARDRWTITGIVVLIILIIACLYKLLTV